MTAGATDGEVRHYAKRYKDRDIWIEVVERRGRFFWAYTINNGPVVRTRGPHGARSPVFAANGALNAAKLAMKLEAIFKQRSGEGL
jgi:hypothetical protein